MSFPVHGAASFQTVDRVLVATVDGPWNIELIQHYFRLMQPFVEELNRQGPWGVVIVIRNEAACPMETLALIRQNVIAQKESLQRVCAAFSVAPGVPGYRIMNRFWRSIYDGIIPFEIFDKPEDAIAWVGQTVAQIAKTKVR